ncbi:excisionase family DNA-binding protein [Streptomyces sp. KHY 26]|uniref:excisionase family DNA-binding protein n=1 Tax=Streptomyces sp. KHY 26 TaxID=3097359 RepID=UPI00376ED4CD
MRLTHTADVRHDDHVTNHSDRLIYRKCCGGASIPDPEQFPTISVTTAAEIVGVARRTGYAAVARGEWPVLRTGRAVRVRTRQFLAQYGLLEAAE